MKAGRDVDGIWTILESGIQYVPIRVKSVCDNTPIPRILAVVSHIPWVIFPLIAFSKKESAMFRSREFCRERTLQRLQMGADRKDLFYYLVSVFIELFTSLLHKSR